MDVNEVDEMREALRRADMALAGLRNALVVERELQARCADLERERDDMIATCAAGAAEIAKSRQEEREYKAQIAALTAERDAARADLARYTAVYGDPDAPVEPLAPDLDMGTPLLPGLAAMADRILASDEPDCAACRACPAGAICNPCWVDGVVKFCDDRDLAEQIARAPQIKVGAHVCCESLGGVTGRVARVTSTQSGGIGCIVRDDEMGHEWFAMADLLEVIR